MFGCVTEHGFHIPGNLNSLTFLLERKKNTKNKPVFPVPVWGQISSSFIIVEKSDYLSSLVLSILFPFFPGNSSLTQNT